MPRRESESDRQMFVVVVTMPRDDEEPWTAEVVEEACSAIVDSEVGAAEIVGADDETAWTGALLYACAKIGALRKRDGTEEADRGA